jgi:hypothetical protein
VTTNDGRMGCSLDRLVIGRPIGLEIKCCAPANHMGFLIDGYHPALTTAPRCKASC